MEFVDELAIKVDSKIHEMDSIDSYDDNLNKPESLFDELLL